MSKVSDQRSVWATSEGFNNKSSAQMYLWINKEIDHMYSRVEFHTSHLGTNLCGGQLLSSTDTAE